MKNFVRTGETITDAEYNSIKDIEYLVLPDGLDNIEKTLKKEIRGKMVDAVDELRVKNIISSVFSKFKQKQGVSK